MISTSGGESHEKAAVLSLFLVFSMLIGAPTIAAQGDRHGSPDDAPAAGIDTLAIESHARFLADDLLEGRAPGGRGEAYAALYLISEMTELGLEPLPSAGAFRLEVPLTAVSFDHERAVVRLADGARTRSLRPPVFYHPGGSRAAFRDFAGDLLFAGAAAGALLALEDYLDLSGRVIVLTPPWSGVDTVEAELVRRGASGVLNLVPDTFMYGRLRIVRGPTRFFLPDGIDDPANQSRLPSLVGGSELIEMLGLRGGEVGSTLDRARPLGLGIDVELPYTTEPRPAYNVAGFVAGADPALQDEWVVYVAHYDHVGYGEPTRGDSIWNGFIDNAIGSSMLLEIARQFAGDPPGRSVVFLWVTAEEQGLLGSNWFVHHSPIPLDRIRAVVNIDGGAPPGEPLEWGIVGADESTAGEIARKVVEDRGWTVDSRPIGPQSDHWPFARAGVPSILLFPGSSLEGLSDAEARALRERWLHPHTPDDEWHPDFPFAGVRRYAELALEIGRTLASDPRIPENGTSSPP